MLEKFSALLHRAAERRRQCRELSRLSDRDLRELGLSPTDRRWIVGRKFWRKHPFAPSR
jgi:uncharacterized protein YjiS (DUF1127 family)